MTVTVSAREIVTQLDAKFPALWRSRGKCRAGEKRILACRSRIPKTADGLKFDYLNYITAVDYYGYFEVVYQLTSLEYNHPWY